MFAYIFIQAGARLVVHDTKQWPLVDEYGMDISPATSTLAPITEVRFHNYSLSIMYKYFIYIYIYIYIISIYFFQIKLKRQTDPYPANCTGSWASTNYTNLVQDPIGHYNEGIRNRVHYNLAVNNI